MAKSDSITYKPSSPMARVVVGKYRIRAGDTVTRADIPDDAFDYLASRADFEGAKPKTVKKPKSDKPKGEEV